MSYTTNCLQQFNLFLASNSPRRSDLLTQAGYSFKVFPADIDEAAIKNNIYSSGAALPGYLAKELSAAKAQSVCLKLSENLEQGQTLTDYFNKYYLTTKILAADTIVACGNQILGKPVNRQDAMAMLQFLSGKTHQVFTGFSILSIEEGNCGSLVLTGNVSSVSTTEVTFYPLSYDDINWYINTGECDDKAGSYGIQGLGARFIKSINGDYNNVVGLPLAEVCKAFM